MRRREQPEALRGRIGDPEIGHRARVVRAQPKLAFQAAGIDAPHSDAIRASWPAWVIGMIPGSTGTSIPAARIRSTKRK